MKLRFKLIAAFLILAALPLTAVVLYSYSTSAGVFRRAVEDETQGLAEGLVGRLEEVRDDLEARLEGLGSLPIRTLIAPEEVPEDEISQVYSDLMEQIDEVSSLVESLEFTPVGQRIDDPGWTAPGAGEHLDRAAATSQDYLQTWVIYPSRTLADALRKLLERPEIRWGELGLSRAYLTATLSHAVKQRSSMAFRDVEALEAHAQQARELLGTEFDTPVRRDGEIVGYIRAHVKIYPIVRQILTSTRREPGDLPYAIDGHGKIYLAEPGDRERLEEIRADPKVGKLVAGEPDAGWIVAEAPYPDSELRFFIARPIADSLQDLRQTALRNFSGGMLAIALALIGIFVLSGRMTRNLSILAEGAESLATGNLSTRVPVRSRDEIGQLATSFNRMAKELSNKQQLLLEQQLQQRLLEAENQRKSQELEEARQFQLSLLPNGVPEHPSVVVAAHMQTATEVGGDYYDFMIQHDGSLIVAIGDATGHGAMPGTMVTVIKGLFSAGAADSEPVDFLTRATRTIRRMNLGRMQMALTLARVNGSQVSISAAGMPPALLHRRAVSEVEEIALHGMPLGGLTNFAYDQRQTSLASGDSLLLMTDGFPELANHDRDPLGYDRVRELFSELAGESPAETLAALTREADRWRGDMALEDDITFVLLRAR